MYVTFVILISALTTTEGRVSKRPEKKGTVPKKAWTELEKNAILRQFAKNIRCQQVPGKAECEAAKSVESVLLDRHWKNIKYCVKNLISAQKVTTFK